MGIFIQKDGYKYYNWKFYVDKLPFLTHLLIKIILYICQKITMSKSITPYKNSNLGKKEQVTQMFDAISGTYDGLNRVISLGIDVKWRKKVVALIREKQPTTILDIATGTGDLALLMADTSAEKIIGLDLSVGMLRVGEEKIKAKNLSAKIEMVVGDSENIPYADNYFDAITVSFGIRNFETLEKGLSEIYRVLKPGGLFVILETSVPTRFPYKQGYAFYTKFILPIIGKLFSKDQNAYGYLSESAANVPFGENLNNILRKISFIECKAMPQTFGVATIYTATKK